VVSRAARGLARRGGSAAARRWSGVSSLIVSLVSITDEPRDRSFPRFCREANSAKNLTRPRRSSPDTSVQSKYSAGSPEESEEAPCPRGRTRPPASAPPRGSRMATPGPRAIISTSFSCRHGDDVRERHAEMIGHTRSAAPWRRWRNHLEVVSRVMTNSPPRHGPRQVVADDGKRLGMAMNRVLTTRPCSGSRQAGDDFQGHRCSFPSRGGPPLSSRQYSCSSR